MAALLFDTETTGLTEPVLVEAAWYVIPSVDDIHRADLPAEVHLFNPGKPISPAAMATHHIIDEDVQDAPPAATFRLPDGIEYLIGHNVDFDWEVIGKPPLRRICTLALARWLWPTLESHSQAALLYQLRGGREMRGLLAGSHRAMTDVSNLLLLLRDVVTAIEIREQARIGKPNGIDWTWSLLWQFSEVARVPTHMPFGKHKGLPIKDVPRDYVRWLLGQPDVDPYLRKALTT